MYDNSRHFYPLYFKRPRILSESFPNNSENTLLWAYFPSPSTNTLHTLSSTSPSLSFARIISFLFLIILTTFFSCLNYSNYIRNWCSRGSRSYSLVVSNLFKISSGIVSTLVNRYEIVFGDCVFWEFFI